MPDTSKRVEYNQARKD